MDGPGPTRRRGATPGGGGPGAQTGARAVVRAPAKLNLGLEVLFRRPDGFHEIRTVLQAVTLWDRVDLELSESPGVALEVRPAGLDLGPDEANLAVRAARRLPPPPGGPPGVRITLHKRIPAGAGLGGGSADAAAVLVGLARLRRAPCPPEELERIGAELGSDVPFFIRGGTQWGSGRGEILRALPPWPSEPLVVVFPGRTLSTAAVYGSLKSVLTARDPLPTFYLREFGPDPRCAASSGADSGSDSGAAFWARLRPVLRNDLQPAVLAAEAGTARALQLLEELGSGFSRVTGSGSAVFGAAPDGASAESWVRRFQELGFWARCVRPTRGGCSYREP